MPVTRLRAVFLAALLVALLLAVVLSQRAHADPPAQARPAIAVGE